MFIRMHIKWSYIFYKHAYSYNMPLFLPEKLFHNVIYIEYILMNTLVFVAMVTISMHTIQN